MYKERGEETRRQDESGSANVRRYGGIYPEAPQAVMGVRDEVS